MKITETRIVNIFTLNMREDGILHTHVSSERVQTVNDLKEVVPIVGEMVNYKQVPLLVTLDDFALPSADVRKFWADKETCPYNSAEAFIAVSPGHKMIGNFYLAINKPGRPTKMFSKEEEAIIWLKFFIPKK